MLAIERCKQCNIMALLTSICFFFVIIQGCAAEDMSACSGADALRECVVTSGAYAGYQIGMFKREAFEVACKQSKRFQITSPDLTTNGKYENFHGTSICDLEDRAMAAELWSFVRQSWSSQRSIWLYFSGDVLEKIRTVPRGFTP